MSDEAEIARRPPRPAQPSNAAIPPRRSTRVEVNGWINLDKPVGVTSTQAVARLKRLFNAKKVGHAGTLDPLASGVLPVAFGEATKTVPIVQDGAKAYEFVVQAGARRPTPTTPRAGSSRRSEARPTPRGDRGGAAALRRRHQPDAADLFGDPHRRRARLRSGARRRIVRDRAAPIVVHRLELVAAEPDEARFEAECGKGAYVRAIARDLGRALGCHGHVVLLRRTRVGPFRAEGGVGARRAARIRREARAAALLPVEAGLAELPRLADRPQRRGDPAARPKAAAARRGDAPGEGPAYAALFRRADRLRRVEDGYFVSTRVFNLPG